MKKRTFSALVFVFLCMIFIMPASASETAQLNVEVSEDVIEVMREKGPELYVRMGIYKGF